MNECTGDDDDALVFSFPKEVYRDGGGGDSAVKMFTVRTRAEMPRTHVNVGWACSPTCNSSTRKMETEGPLSKLGLTKSSFLTQFHLL